MSAAASPAGLGGVARVGWGSRTGSDLLAVSADCLTLRCFRTYRFAPDQVVRIERSGPAWLDAGVRIVHNREDYPRAMAFHCRGGSDQVIALLARAGFAPSGQGPAGRSSLLTAVRLLLLAIAVYALAAGLLPLIHEFILQRTGLPS